MASAFGLVRPVYGGLPVVKRLLPSLRLLGRLFYLERLTGGRVVLSFGRSPSYSRRSPPVSSSCLGVLVVIRISSNARNGGRSMPQVLKEGQSKALVGKKWRTRGGSAASGGTA